MNLTQMALEPNVGCAPESQPEFIPHEITNVYIFVVEAVTNISGEKCYQILFKIQRRKGKITVQSSLYSL